MTKQTNGIVGLTDKNIRGGEADMIDILVVKADGYVKDFLQHLLEELIAGHNGGIVVEQLPQRQIVANLNCNGIDGVITLVGCKMKLSFMLETGQEFTLMLHAVGEEDVVYQLIVKFHEI